MRKNRHALGEVEGKFSPFPPKVALLAGGDFHARSRVSLAILSHSETREYSQSNLSGESACAAILLPLLPASLTHKNPQRCKVIHGMRP